MIKEHTVCSTNVSIHQKRVDNKSLTIPKIAGKYLLSNTILTQWKKEKILKVKIIDQG